MTQDADLNQKFSHHMTSANDVTLHYVIGGEGAPVLLWHGFLETWYCWSKIMPALAEKQTERFANHKITTPILALGGEKSIGDRVRAMLENVATNVRGGAVERCGHFIADERPDDVVERLLKFFDEVQQF